jgi:hypothetical protein
MTGPAAARASPSSSQTVAGDVVATLLGPASRTLARSFGRRGHERLVAAVVHVDLTGSRRTETEAAVAMRLVHGATIAHGSTTARMREAMSGAHAWLCARQPPVGAPAMTVHAALVAAEGDEVYVAWVGPSRVVRSGTDASPGRDTEPRWQSLGGLAEPVVQFDRWSVRAGEWVAVLEPRPALEGELPSKAIAELPAETALQALADRLGDDVALVMITRSRAVSVEGAPAPEPARTHAPETAGGTAPAPQGPLVARPGATPPSAPAHGPERAARHAIQASARVLHSTLPDRPMDYGVEGWARPGRWLAVAAIAIPLAVVTLSVWASERLGGVTAPAIGADARTAGVAPELAAGDAGGPDVPLAFVEAVSAVPGAPEDERHLVVVGEEPYVLNRPLNRVDRVSGGIQQQVLSRGAAVGDAVVGNLLDLLWVPGADPDVPGHVLALDAAGALWSIDDGVITAVPRSREPPWDRVERAGGAAGALFALEQSSRQVLRHRADAGRKASYSTPGLPWLDEPVDLTDSTDIAVDDAVTVLWRDGRLARFEDGRLAWQVAVGQLGDDAASPSVGAAAQVPVDTPAAYVSATTGRTLVADRASGRIVVVGPSGELIERLVAPPQPAAQGAGKSGAFADLHDVWWDDTSGRLYIVAGGGLYAAPYEAPSSASEP